MPFEHLPQQSSSSTNHTSCLGRSKPWTSKLITHTIKITKKSLSLIGFLSLTLCLTISPTLAATEKLGVLRSQDNERQWRGIARRLQAVGVDYCVIDTSQEQESWDLANVKVLFIPNVETLSGKQVANLQEWMDKGGQVIVSGPTGSLSQPDVRSRLRGILGAYWGFPLVSPSTVEPLQVRQQGWLWKKDLSATVQGGVIIPAGMDSHTAAVWSAEGSQPAVIVTDQSTFLGWRWGVDTASPAEVDTAWLQAIIGRYGDLSPANSSTAKACNPGGNIASEPPTELSSNNSESPSTEDSQTNRSVINDIIDSPTPANVRPRPQPRRRGYLSATQILTMREELEALINRYENALLLADATNSDLNLATGEALDKFVLSREEESPLAPEPNQALEQAQSGLKNFLALIEQRDYQGARQEWFQARRTLWDNYPSDRPLTQPEIRAIWLDRGTIVKAKSESDLAKIFDRLAEAGINTVFFETVNASYPVYPSEVAPEQNPLTKGWDPLAAAIKLAHERNMELHAWAWIFAAANQRHNTLVNQPTHYLGPVLSANPDWANKDKRGNIFHGSSKKAFFDPAHPEARRYLFNLLEEIATKYEVDGIQLDYIRYPFQDPNRGNVYGYGVAARQLFKEQNGVDPVNISLGNRQMWSKWTDFRIQQVDSFVAEAAKILRAKRPQLLISAAVFPIPQQERLTKLQQNWEQWAQHGDIDMVVAMSYAQNSNQLKQITQPLFNQAALGSSLLIPGIRLLNLPDAIALDQVQLLRDLPSGGYALFAAENLNSNLASIFGRIQSSDEPTARILPHRQPFQAAAARYQLLQREWSYLLSNNQLTIDADTMEEWAIQADSLASILNRLAEEPSMRRFLQAKLAISTFKRQFPGFMEQQAQQKPYQVEAWSNRLGTVERLINYGEKLVSTSK